MEKIEQTTKPKKRDALTLPLHSNPTLYELIAYASPQNIKNGCPIYMYESIIIANYPKVSTLC